MIEGIAIAALCIAGVFLLYHKERSAHMRVVKKNMELRNENIELHQNADTLKTQRDLATLDTDDLKRLYKRQRDDTE